MDDHYIGMAKKCAAMSPDPSTKVGAYVLSEMGHTAGFGFNDMPVELPAEFWNNRDLKYKFVVHAEVEALLKAGRHAFGGKIYVTAHPCRECAKMIAAIGISCVVCPEEPWRDDPAVVETVNDAKDIFKVCSVQVQYYKEERS